MRRDLDRSELEGSAGWKTGRSPKNQGRGALNETLGEFSSLPLIWERKQDREHVYEIKW